jgi:hypothetical protein
MTKKIYRKILASTVLVVIAISLFVVYMFPFWTGEIIYPGGKNNASQRVEIPGYYYAAADWLNNQSGDFVCYSLPMTRLGYVAYTWDHGYYGSDITLGLFSMPIITSGEAGNGASGIIADMILNNQTFNFGETLALMSVKYVIFHNDTNWGYIEGNQLTDYSMPRQDFLTFLNSSNGLYLEKQFGELYIYRNTYWEPSFIYSTSNPISTNGNFTDVIKEISNSTLNQSLFGSDDSNSSLVYQKLNPTAYVVRTDSSHPFFLVFSETYDPGWVAYIDGKEVSDHFTAYGFANGWYINETGSFDVTLRFLPQITYYYGVAISVTVLISGALTILVLEFKKSKTGFRTRFQKPKQKIDNTECV